MTSGSWAGQPYGQLWASNSPLYGLIAMPSLWACGASVQTWRGTWAVLYVALTAAYLRSLAGFGLVRSPWTICLGGIAMLTAPCMFLVVTSGRGIDIACFAVVVTGVASLALLTGFAKVWGLFFAGMIMPWAGIQLFPAVAAVVAFGLFIDWRRMCSVGVVLGLGALCGIVSLFCVLAALGVLKVFVSQTFASGFTSLGAVAQAVLVPGATSIRVERFNVFQGIWSLFSAGPETMVLIAVVIIKAIDTLARRRSSNNWAWVIGLATMGIVGVPCFMVIAGRWVLYYFWMAFLLLLAAAMSEDGVGTSRRPWSRALQAAAMAAVCVGCIADSYVLASITHFEQKDRVAEALDSLVDRTARVDDVALVDFTVYFRFRPRVARVYTPSYGGGKLFRMISDEEQQRMTLVVIQRIDMPHVFGKKLQGDWVEYDQQRTSGLDTEDLVVFRRVATGSDNLDGIPP